MANVKNARFGSGKLGPGPAAYKLPTSVGYDYDGGKKVDRHISKMYTFGTRSSLRYNTIGPGPVPSGPAPKAGYEDVMTRVGKPASYKYTFGHRTTLVDRDRKPGPSDCQPDSAKMKKDEFDKITGNRAPKYTFGIRPAQLRRDMGPAANTYFQADKDTKLMPNIGDMYKKRAPKYTMSPRLNQRVDFRSPGAAAYHPYDSGKDPIRPRAADYTMRTRPPVNYATMGPGPGFYDIRPVKGIKDKANLQPTAVDGKRAPAYTFGTRNTRAPMIVPGDVC